MEMVGVLSSCVCLSVFLVLIIEFFKRVWWTPNRIKRVFGLQGIKGPPYRFLHGSTKEMIKMREESLATPMDLSHDIFPRVQPHVSTWVKLYGTNFLQWIGPKAQLVITDPGWIKEVLNNRDGIFPKIQVEDYFKKLLGDGLATSNGEKWVRLRKLANYAFHAESLKGMIPAMIASVEMMLERWRFQEGKEIEVQEEFTVLTSEIISRTAFGSSYLEGQNIFRMIVKLAFLGSKNAFNVRIPGIKKLVKTPDEIESEELERGVRDSIIKIIKKRENNMSGEVDLTGITDFLGLLIKAHREADMNKRISIDDLVDECKTFYFGGHETTSSLLTWMILLLAMHQDWQDKARMEVLELFGHQNPNPDGILKMKTVGMIINETLRLYAPIVSISRKTYREVTLGKIRVPANVEIQIPQVALHHNPQIWGEDVHSFKPERFAEGVAKATNNHPGAFLPFGSGPRICVGLNFATTEAKIALSMILQRYKFTVSPTYVHAPTQIITVRPQFGAQVVFNAL